IKMNVIVPYDDDSLILRMYSLCANVYEEFIEVLYTWLTKKGRLERALESHWTSRAAKMLNIEKALRQRSRGVRYHRVAPRLDVSQAEMVLEEAQVTFHFSLFFDSPSAVFILYSLSPSQMGHAFSKVARKLKELYIKSVRSKRNVTASGSDRERMKDQLEIALQRIEAHEHLCEKVEVMRTTVYDPSNSSHSCLLSQLWNLLNPNDPIDGMKSKRWPEIGFQGNDPSTDFRGMGILSLHQLIYFVQYESETSRAVLSLSHHPTIGFPFAVAGINFTSLTRKFLKEGLLKSHFYNTLDHSESIDDFHHAYVRIFTLFADFYKREKPATVMEFNVIQIKFESALRRQLERTTANLDMISLDDL
ncbi:hypothetical protein PRIPAC_89349, partial [Pristionchus pacificus]